MLPTNSFYKKCILSENNANVYMNLREAIPTAAPPPDPKPTCRQALMCRIKHPNKVIEVSAASEGRDQKLTSEVGNITRAGVHILDF